MDRKIELVSTIKHGEFKRFFPWLGFLTFPIGLVGILIIAMSHVENTIGIIFFTFTLFLGLAVIAIDNTVSPTWREYYLDLYGNKKVVYSGKYRKHFGDLEKGEDSQEWKMSGYMHLSQ
ncbi:hypothetical protein LCGC14_0861680 [marine sediment metagenome]|uniref:Uncharacterized protein n=1 Tax=marine sediment metagenome TaxID=412755 RepID=A0A0F9PSL1_9ZZZZ